MIRFPITTKRRDARKKQDVTTNLKFIAVVASERRRIYRIPLGLSGSQKKGREGTFHLRKLFFSFKEIFLNLTIAFQVSKQDISFSLILSAFSSSSGQHETLFMIFKFYFTAVGFLLWSLYSTLGVKLEAINCETLSHLHPSKAAQILPNY